MTNKRIFLNINNLYIISLRFLFNSPSWQKSPVNSVRVQSQIGPWSVAMHTPSFLQGLPWAQALTVLDRTPCKKKTEHISISPRFSSRHPWWLGKLCNGVALFVLQAKRKLMEKLYLIRKLVWTSSISSSGYFPRRKTSKIFDCKNFARSIQLRMPNL